jgi:cell division protein FtsW
MSQVFAAERVEKQKSDFLMICCFMLLVGVGLAMLFSASYFRSSVIKDSPWRIFTDQCLLAAVSLVLAVVASRLPLQAIRSFLPWLLAISLILMLLTFIPGVGEQYLGGRRWVLIFGRSFQPSELVKLCLILYLASVLDKKQGRLDVPTQGLVPPFVMVMLFAGLIFMQNNFSTALFILTVSLAIFFAAGVKLRYFGLTLVLIVPFAIISILTKEHRLDRILTYIKPEEDPTGAGYQILASLSLLKHGGFAGTGMGLGTRKLGGMPEAQSDFIFAVLGEELGFIGVVAVIALFAFLAWRGYRTARLAPTVFLRLLAFGLTTSIIVQAMINFAVVSNLIPATGIPLPFFSSGGSSLMITLIMCGLLVNVSRQIEPEAKQEVGNG